jgi:eukaryotic-like serine/threonine-protein kinase
MLTGHHPWPCKSAVDTLHAILHDDPLPIPSTSQVNVGLAAIVQKLLRKNPADRYQSAEAVLEALAGRGTYQSSSTTTLVMPKRRIPWRRLLWAVPIAAVLIAAFWLWPRGSALRATDLSLATTDAGLHIEPALSRDGKMLAYASDRAGGFLNIWVQQVGGGESLQITKGTVNNAEPCFSPDGTQIAYRSEQDGGGVYVVPALGGTPRRIANEGRRPRFSPDGESIAYWVGDEGIFSQNRVYVIGVKGGEPRRLAGTVFSAYYPIWS